MDSRKTRMRPMPNSTAGAYYDRFAGVVVDNITSNWYFSAFIKGIFIVSIVLVGLSLYPTLETSRELEIVSRVVAVSFSIELILLIIAEGVEPLTFINGEGWKLNILFIAVTLMNVVIAFFAEYLGTSAYFLRIALLLRLTEIVRRFPQLGTIIFGLTNSVKSIGYVVLLLLLVMYFFAIIGVYAFRRNDPLHFGNLQRAMLTLFRLATLDSWGEVMYINYYGCDVYHGNVYSNIIDHGEEDSVFSCVHPLGREIIAPVYFVFFTLVSSLTVLNLFVGTVMISMRASMEELTVANLEEARDQRRRMKLKRLHKDRLGGKAGKLLAMQSDDGDSRSKSKGKQGFSMGVLGHSKEKLQSWLERVSLCGCMQVGQKANRYRAQRQKRVMAATLVRAWDGAGEKPILVYNRDTALLRSLPRWALALLDTASACKLLVESSKWLNFITFMVIFGAALLGWQTYDLDENERKAISICEAFLACAIAADYLLRTLAQDFRPWLYCATLTGILDLCVFVGAALPVNGTLTTLLRLPRILRLIQLGRRLPQLALVMDAVSLSIDSIALIGFLLGLMYYVFAVLGVAMLKNVDPWNFSSLHMAALAAFCASTLEGWSATMYTNIYGCYDFPSAGDVQCSDSVEGLGWGAAIYFICFTMISGLVLLTMLIGAVSTGMEKADEELCARINLAERVRVVAWQENLSKDQLALYKDIFHHLDLDGGGTVDENELLEGLKEIGREPTEEQVQIVLAKAAGRDRAIGSNEKTTENQDDGLDMADFVQLMAMLVDECQDTDSEENGDDDDAPETISVTQTVPVTPTLPPTVLITPTIPLVQTVPIAPTVFSSPAVLEVPEPIVRRQSIIAKRNSRFENDAERRRTPIQSPFQSPRSLNDVDISQKVLEPNGKEMTLMQLPRIQSPIQSSRAQSSRFQSPIQSSRAQSSRFQSPIQSPRVQSSRIQSPIQSPRAQPLRFQSPRSANITPSESGQNSRKSSNSEACPEPLKRRKSVIERRRTRVKMEDERRRTGLYLPNKDTVTISPDDSYMRRSRRSSPLEILSGDYEQSITRQSSQKEVLEPMVPQQSPRN